jgi:hypothetical protein
MLKVKLGLAFGLLVALSACEVLGGGAEACVTTCLDPADSSSEFRQCNAEAKSCDDLTACKNKY